MRIAVVGGGTVEETDRERAYRVGRKIGERGHELVCGGRGGVMEAACRGATESGGRTIGILPGLDLASANEYVDVPIATGIGNARNARVAANGEAGIAIDGSYGTLSEIALLLDAGRPVAGLGTHDVDGVVQVRTAEAAVEAVESGVDRV